MASLNFNKIQKQYFNVTLTDKNKTTLMICNPSKKLLSEITTLDSILKNDGDSNAEDEIDSLYEVCSKIMSRNKANIKVGKELLEEILDIEDIMIFLKSYMEFISKQSKN